MARKIRMGMVGGGEGAFIGAVHRIAANMDGQIELVCGAFSSDPQRCVESGKNLYLPATRCYDTYDQMMEREADLPADQRMDFVAIVTPNHLHFPVAAAAIRHGFHIMSDKPATLNLAEALELRALLQGSGLRYGLTHVYTGYPLVKEARARVAAGELGTLRKVVVDYPQGWLADQQESKANKQAEWRLDPARAGVSSCMGDIGVHAFNLAEYVCGQTVTEICADLASVVPGRTLDDDGTVLMRFDGGARGVLLASQISVGEENALKIRLYGDKAGLEWSQQEPNTLLLKYNDRPAQLLRTAGPGLGDLALANSRTPAGHPEGYLEAFANLYRNFAQLLQCDLQELEPPSAALDLPGVDEAVRGMAFIEQVVASAASDNKWQPLLLRGRQGAAQAAK